MSFFNFNSFYGRLSPTVKVLIGGLILGVLIKTQRLPYAEYIIAGTAVLIALFSVIELIQKPIRSLADYTVRIFVSSFSISMALSVLHYPYRLPFTLIAAAAILVHFISEQFFGQSEGMELEGQKDEEPADEDKNYLLHYIGGGVVILGVIVKILHIVGGDLLILGGLVLMVVAMLISTFKK